MERIYNSPNVRQVSLYWQETNTDPGSSSFLLSVLFKPFLSNFNQREKWRGAYFFVTTSNFPRPVITDQHKTGDLKQQIFILSQFGVRSQHQAVSRATLPAEAPGKGLIHTSSNSQQLWKALDFSGLAGTSLPCSYCLLCFSVRSLLSL